MFLKMKLKIDIIELICFKETYYQQVITLHLNSTLNE